MPYPLAMSEILNVDLLQFETGTSAQRGAIVEATMRSLRSGFVFTEHDLSEDLLDTTYGMLEQFFTLSPEQKQTATVAGSNGQAGYTGLLVETAAVSDNPDWKEMLNWGVDVPAGHPLKEKFPYRYNGPQLPDHLVPGISDVLVEFYDRVLDIQRRFLRIIALGIGCHETFFDAMTVYGTTLTRAIHYPAMDMAPGAEHVWAAEHDDINLITALPRATAKGLQVRLDDGSWVDAIPPEGSMIMNTGIMLEHITNGLIPGGWHRVVADPDHVGDRYSVVQFCHPTPWTILNPVPSCITPQNPQRFAPIQAGDRLDQVLYEINLVEDGRRVDEAKS